MLSCWQTRNGILYFNRDGYYTKVSAKLRRPIWSRPTVMPSVTDHIYQVLLSSHDENINKYDKLWFLCVCVCALVCFNVDFLFKDRMWVLLPHQLPLHCGISSKGGDVSHYQAWKKCSSPCRRPGGSTGGRAACWIKSDGSPRGFGLPFLPALRPGVISIGRIPTPALWARRSADSLTLKRC